MGSQFQLFGGYFRLKKNNLKQTGGTIFEKRSLAVHEEAITILISELLDDDKGSIMRGNT